jgi:phenylalanyl-tRNA synthetase alpha chain
MLEKIDELAAAAAADLDAVADAAGLEDYRIKYLGSKGAVKSLMGLIKDVPKDAKREFGQRANAARVAVEEAFGRKQQDLGHGAGSASSKAKNAGPIIDITQPAAEPRRGRRHIITQTIDELIDVFGRMGFDVETGPEVEDDHHNFVALNIPDTHPARDPLDNFYLSAAGAAAENRGGALMRSQTSTVQIRVMEKTQPPTSIHSGPLPRSILT